MEGSLGLKVCYNSGVVSIIIKVIAKFNRVPHGCFEQLSVTTFPLVLGINILKRLNL